MLSQIEIPDLDRSAVWVSGLVKRYGSLCAVDGMDLEVVRGECFGLLGPNGAGKTTTVEVLEGLLPYDEGVVRVLGETWQDNAMGLRQRLGIALQENHLADRLTVWETLTMFRSFFRRGKHVEELISLVGLTEKSKTWVSRLSGGQRQRLAIACALVGDPELLFLDEPTTGLDPQSRRRLWDVVRDFVQGGGTCILTTHYMEEAEELCDRVGVVDHGKMIAQGPPSELIGQLQGSRVLEFASHPLVDASFCRGLAGVKEVRKTSAGWCLVVDSLCDTASSLVTKLQESGVALVHLDTRRASLEDVFLSLTGRGLQDHKE